MKKSSRGRKSCSGGPGSWAHSWAQTPAVRRNHTGSDAKGPGVFLKKSGQIEPDATIRRRVVRTPKPGVAGSSPAGPVCRRSLILSADCGLRAWAGACTERSAFINQLSAADPSGGRKIASRSNGDSKPAVNKALEKERPPEGWPSPERDAQEPKQPS